MTYRRGPIPEQDAPQLTTNLPDIPGYVLESSLTSDASVGVYLARETATQRQVVVKFISSEESASDSGLNELLSASTGLRAKQSHPNLMTILGSGYCAEGRYLVCEYLSGGNLHQRLQGGLHIQALIKVVKDVGRALEALHAAGLIHCDVKPENILFRNDGTAVLADYGIVRLTGTTSRSGRNVLRGSPEYMSPEHAAGRPLDERADIYSLGIVLFHSLTGELPYRARSPVEYGIKHLQEPIPRLPSHLAMFQALIDKALAKRPDQRIATASDFVQMLEEARTTGLVGEAVIRTDPISTREIFSAGGDFLATQLDPTRLERRKRTRRRRRVVRVLGGLLLLGLLAGGAYWAYERQLIDVERMLASLGIGEDPLLQTAWTEAQSLHQDPNQSLATIVAAYRRVLAINPGHEGASIAVDNLTTEWRTTIDDLLLQGSLESASTRLEEANLVFPNDVEWIQLSTRLQNRERAERIYASTRSLLTSHGLSDLPSATAAIQSFQEVQRLAPGHADAAEALEELAVHYASLARIAALDGDVSGAISLLERATAADQTLPDLDEVRTLISRATTAQAAIEQLLQEARRFRAGNQLITPPGENAAELYQRVLAADTNNVVALQGLNELRAQLSATTDSLLAAGRLDEVEQMAEQAAAAGMATGFVNDLRGRLDSELERVTRIEEGMANARSLMAQGFLTAPADGNAVTELRTVQQLDPANEEARAMLKSIAERLAGVAVEAREFGLDDQAKQYLNLALTLTPDNEEWIALRDSWGR